MLSLLLMACNPKPGGDVAWATNYATVTPSAFGLEGVHVWSFYSEGWDADHDPAYHLCSLLQRLEGEESDLSLEGCSDCESVYELRLDELEHDCEGDLEDRIDEPAYEGITAFALGPVPADLSEDDPYPGSSLGWYLSYDDEIALPQGWAWAEGLEYEREVEEGWTTDQSYTLWPAYAWDLRP